MVLKLNHKIFLSNCFLVFAHIDFKMELRRCKFRFSLEPFILGINSPKSHFEDPDLFPVPIPKLFCFQGLLGECYFGLVGLIF